MKKKVLIIVLSVVCGIVFVSGIVFAAILIPYAAEAESFDVSATSMRNEDIVVMDYNVRCFSTDDLGERSWFSRAEMIVDQIRDIAPDILTLQEVSKIQQKYFDKYLVGYNCVYKFRNDSISTEASPIFYRADRFELIKEETFWISETPNVMSKGFGAKYYRICTCAVLKEIATGRKLAVFNTHLDHQVEKARLSGIDLVIEKNREYGDLPMIFNGDMNDYEGSTTYNKAVENFLDSKYQAEDTMHSITYQGFGKKLTTPDSPIDYCFVSKTGIDVDSYKVLNYKVDGKYCSDHYAIVVKLRLV